MIENEAPLIFLSDPKRFMELVMTDDPQIRSQGFTHLKDVILCEIVRYGFYNDARMIGDLRRLYHELVMPMPQDERKEIYGHICGMVKNTSFVSANAFLPFIVEESSRGIVSTAVIDYVSLAPLTNDDPMSRPKDIIGMLESGMLENEGAAFGALLHLGDRRVCKLIWPFRDSLDPKAIDEAVNCATGFLYAATIDFYIDWLEGMEGDLRDGLFGVVASGLVLMKRWSQSDQVFTGQRPFPTTGTTREDWIRLTKPVDLADYVKRVAPRLYALERSEPPPRIMPHVLTEWGLKPVSDPNEAEVFDDRRRGAVAPVLRAPAEIPDGQIVDQKAEWFDGQGTIFLVWGLLNPNGPTLYTLGERVVNGKRRVFFRWLHMLGGCTTYAAHSDPETLTYNDIYAGCLSIHDHLVGKGVPGVLAAIPSFLMVNRGDPTLVDIAHRILTNGPAGRADWGKEMAYVRAYGDDFFSRAGCEIRSFYDAERQKAVEEGDLAPDHLRFIEARYGHLPQFRDAVIPPFDSSEMTPTLFHEWWNTINTVPRNKAALSTLATMWNGASSLLPEHMKRDAVPFKPIMDFLVSYNFDYT